MDTYVAAASKHLSNAGVYLNTLVAYRAVFGVVALLVLIGCIVLYFMNRIEKSEPS